MPRTPARAADGLSDADLRRPPTVRVRAGKKTKLTRAQLEQARQVPKGYDPNRFPKPSVACDLVCLAVDPDTPAEGVQVLLIERGGIPFTGFWAIPGGFLDMEEDLETAARRELAEETTLGAKELRHVPVWQLGAYGTPDRDPRDRVLSVVYVALLPYPVRPTAADDAAKARWHAVESPALPKLAFDHDQILADAVASMRDRILRQPILRATHPGDLSARALRAVYEPLLGQPLQAAALRRVLQANHVLEPTDRRATYRFRRR